MARTQRRQRGLGSVPRIHLLEAKTIKQDLDVKMLDTAHALDHGDCQAAFHALRFAYVNAGRYHQALASGEGHMDAQPKYNAETVRLERLSQKVMAHYFLKGR